MDIGFIGLGYMGKAIAGNLLKAGYDLIVFDVREAPIAELEKLGARRAHSAAEVASKSECTFTMVLNDEQSREVILGKGGVLEGITKGVLIILSTINPDLAKEIAVLFQKRKGIPVMEAQVSGVPGAAGGTMIFMVGGPLDVYKTYLPVLNSVAKSVFYCGDNGSGAVAKLTNALVWEISWNAVSEALKLGAKLGLSNDLLISIYDQSLACCWATRNWHWVKEMMQSKGPLDLEYKDMKMVIGFARKNAVDTPLLDRCYSLRSEKKS
jgi:3-hydroxyisobutyrate dehydrogenase-like beta-hydroxyacid dehydrogenase